MKRQEVETRLKATATAIATHQKTLQTLNEEKRQKILKLKDGELADLNGRIRQGEQQLEDAQLLKAALTDELRDITEKREPEAAKIRKHLQELWAPTIAEYEKLPPILRELQPILEKVTAFNNEANTLANQHESLIGDSIPIPQELQSVCNLKFGALPKTLDTRLASERQEQGLADLLKEQEPTISKILRYAGQTWPNCPICGSRMLAYKRSLDCASVQAG